MRQYKYRFIMDSLNPITKERENRLFVWDGYGHNMQDAKSKIDLMFPCVVVSGQRINITDRKRIKKEFSFACVDMGQLEK